MPVALTNPFEEQCGVSFADRYKKQHDMTMAKKLTCRAMQRELSRQVQEAALHEYG
jgi:hypothetical protein